MIPKIIHYCWLSGDPYPELIEKCIQSWKEKLIDYEFILWDVNRIDISSNRWLFESYTNKKYAFAADYIRFYSLYNYGGIYLDADVEVLKSFDPLLSRDYFLGEEFGGDIEAAVIGGEKGANWVKECLDYYEDRSFIKLDGAFDTRPVPLLVAKIAMRNHLEVLPYYYFSPKNYNTDNIKIKSDTFCVHHFDGKWVIKDWKYYAKSIIHSVIYCILGRKMHNDIIRFIRKIK